MKRILFMFVITCAGCKDPQSTDPTSTPPPAGPPKTMLQTQGCTVAKNQGQVTINCADGSSSVVGIPAAPFYPVDSTGYGYPNLLYIDSASSNGVYRFYNKSSGKIYSYLIHSGIMAAISNVYYSGPNCTGSMYASTDVYSGFWGNQIFLNSTNLSTQAFQVGQFGSVSYSSSWYNAQCTNQSGTMNLGIITATSLDSGVPASFSMPMNLALAQ